MAATKVPEVRDITRIERIGKQLLSCPHPSSFTCLLMYNVAEHFVLCRSTFSHPWPWFGWCSGAKTGVFTEPIPPKWWQIIPQNISHENVSTHWLPYPTNKEMAKAECVEISVSLHYCSDFSPGVKCSVHSLCRCLKGWSASWPPEGQLESFWRWSKMAASLAEQCLLLANLALGKLPLQWVRL